MSISLRAPGGDKTWIATAVIIAGLILVYSGFRNAQWLNVTLAGLVVVGAAGLWFNKQWARWLVIVLFLYYAGFLAVLLVIHPFKWIGLLGICMALYSVWIVWKDFAPGKEDDSEDNPMISLVLLLREPRYLESVVLKQIVSAAWGGDYCKSEDEAEEFVVGESPLFLIHSKDGIFTVNNFDQGYFSDLPAVLEDVHELRLRKALEEHKAWLSVDLMKGLGETSAPETYYPKIARLIAELGGPDCLAIFHPHSGKINVWNAELEEKLRGPNPLEEFSIPTNVPVVHIEDDDPRMLAAVEEARARWPEFVEAFKARAGENFAIKAPITVEDSTEFIWIEVDGLEPEYIHGKLANDPVDLGDLKLGDRVEVPLKDLNDWAFFRDEKPFGLFTVKVLTEARKKRDK
jgi:uncharacterized protein YegJ (DUF2314 family)